MENAQSNRLPLVGCFQLTGFGREVGDCEVMQESVERSARLGGATNPGANHPWNYEAGVPLRTGALERC